MRKVFFFFLSQLCIFPSFTQIKNPFKLIRSIYRGEITDQITWSGLGSQPNSFVLARSGENDVEK